MNENVFKQPQTFDVLFFFFWAELLCLRFQLWLFTYRKFGRNYFNFESHVARQGPFFPNQLSSKILSSKHFRVIVEEAVRFWLPCSGTGFSPNAICTCEGTRYRHPKSNNLEDSRWNRIKFVEKVWKGISEQRLRVLTHAWEVGGGFLQDCCFSPLCVGWRGSQNTWFTEIFEQKILQILVSVIRPGKKHLVCYCKPESNTDTCMLRV